MAEICIAASPGEEASARGLGAALTALGFAASADAPGEAEIAKAVDEAKCVLVLWSKAAPPPALVVLATLALERKKLICAELEKAAAPAPFQAAPRIDLAVRDRAGFKPRFESLVAEIKKLTAPNEGKSEKLTEALALARAALSRRRPRKARPMSMASAIALGVGVLFVVGFGAGRVINSVRTGIPLLPAPAVQVATPTLAMPPTQPAYGLSLAELEALPWREAAAKLNANAATRITTEAEAGDVYASTLACLGHMSGAAGFLPSPAAARAHCDAAAAQGYPAALYLSWALRRAAPHVAVDEATARARLAEAASKGWTAALVDQGLSLAPAADGLIANQTEAGRLWLAAAERGDARGQYYYARWLRDSRAGPRDPAAAIPFLERAAAKNQLDALHLLATFLRDGIGIAQNSARARELYERAATAGYPASMYNLANLLDAGTAEERARAIALYARLSCMRDEQQIRPRAVQRLRALRQAPPACR
jgi:uncharacterized protein